MDQLVDGRVELLDHEQIFERSHDRTLGPTGTSGRRTGSAVEKVARGRVHSPPRSGRRRCQSPRELELPEDERLFDEPEREDERRQGSVM